MGFSPQSGLENATRHGDLDVFAVLYMMERHGWSAEEVRRQLAMGGGLAGLSGVGGGDVRDLEAAGTERASVALDVFVYQVKKTIGAFAAAMGGLDAVAFTGGIGRIRPAPRAVLRRAGISWNSAGYGPECRRGRSRRVHRELKVTVLALVRTKRADRGPQAYRCLMNGSPA